jgi:hypothetical protein
MENEIKNNTRLHVTDSVLRIKLKCKAKRMSYIWASPSSILAGVDGLLEFFDNNRKYHRTAGPAVTFPDGDTYWFIHGTMHREDGPARIWPERGIETWCKNDELYEPSAHEIIAWKMKQKKES